jgi:hypothetical protein
MKAQAKFLSKILPSDVGGEVGRVSFILGNGVKVVGDLSSMNDDIKQQLMLHGLSQKIGDAAAGFSKDRDFHGAFGAMQQVVDNLENGLWASRIGSSTSDLASVLADLQGITVEQAAGAIGKMTEEQLAAVKKHPAVKKAIAELQAARLNAQVAGAESLDDLMAGIGM